MVRMEMRDQNRVDGLWVDAGGLEVVEQAACRVGDLACSSGVDQHQLCAGVHQQCRERDGQSSGREKCGSERVVDFGGAGIADEFLVDRHIPYAVIKCGELITAEVVTIDAGALRCG